MTGLDTKFSEPQVELVYGAEAHALLQDPKFQRAWSQLFSTCIWSTSCQSWGFADAWLSAYASAYEALLVIQANETELIGLLPLAVERSSGSLVHVGAHQAEYQVWLATEENANSFIEMALDALAARYPGRRLELQYLPPGSPIDWCTTGRWGKKAFLQEKRRPLLALGPNSPAEESLRKKSNKSRINRLKKMGPLALIQMQTREQLSTVIDTIADYCDLRQGAINSTLPFRDDHCKREFCLRLMEKPGTTHASVLMLGNQIVAANIGLMNRTSVSLGIVVHSPFLAEHSPGKILILLLARELGQQGFSDFDLTPGGDMYKDRSADHFDSVHVLRVFFNHIDFFRETTKTRIRSAAIHSLERTSPALAVRLKLALQNGLRGMLTQAAGRAFQTTVNRGEVSYHQISIEEARQFPSNTLFKKNCISDLLCYEPVSRWDRSKTEFLLDACRNLEAGAQAYTIAENGVLLHCGWLSGPQGGLSGVKEPTPDLPPSSCVIWDNVAHPDGQARNIPTLCLEQRLHDASIFGEVETIMVKGNIVKHLTMKRESPNNGEATTLHPDAVNDHSRLNFGR